MSNCLYKIIGTFALFALLPSAAHAATFIMYFDITGFPVSNRNPAPTDPVSGTIVWEASEIHDRIQSFDSINLTLDGHAYSVGEISIPPVGYPVSGLIGGILNQTYQIDTLTDDFWITWDVNTLKPTSFDYSSSQKSGIWSVNSAQGFTAFSITAAPEPASSTLLGTGLLCTVAWWYRRARNR